MVEEIVVLRGGDGGLATQAKAQSVRRLDEAASAVGTRQDVRDFGGEVDDRAARVLSCVQALPLWDELRELDGHAIDVES